jgi:hypothetical protein
LDDAAMQKAVQELLDRQAILECLNRYSRGLDRKDLDVLRSAYHPDATDHHGALGDYNPETLITDWLVRDADRTFSHHLLLNTSIDLDGDMAHTETYFQLLIGLKPEAAKNGSTLVVSGGRYIDRFERRNGEWRIARRVLISEFSATMDPIENPHLLEWARRSKEDPAYARPLEGPPAP